MKTIIKSLLALICAVAAWEIILENTVVKSPGFTQHPVLGRIHKPGIVVQGTEGFSRIKINSLGLRGEEIPPKAKNEYRILFVGDSFTKATQVSDTETYVSLLQKKLQSSKLNINTINAGRDGHSPADYIQFADYYNSVIQPDIVIVETNDKGFTNGMLNQEKQFHVVQDLKTFKVIRNQNFSSDNPLSQILLEKFPQLSFLLEYSVVRIGGDNLRKNLSAKETKTNSEKRQIENTKNYDPLVDWTVQELKNKYKNLVILYVPFIDYHPLTEDPSRIETSVKASSNQHGVPFVDLRQDFLEYYHTHHQPTNGFNNTEPGTGHLNDIGHELTAERLAVLLKERGLK